MVAIIGATLIAEFLGAATGPQQSTPPQRGSSYGIGADGTRAYADLLARYGIAIRRQGGTLDSANISAGSRNSTLTAILIDPTTLTANDGSVLETFVRNGGHLVIGGGQIDLRLMTKDAPRAVSQRHETWTVNRPSDFNNAKTVQTAGEQFWNVPGSTAIRIGTPSAALLLRQRLGAGNIDYLADTTLLNNELIAQADNAAFAVALADNGERNVVFLEGAHGAADAEGFGAIPRAWKFAAIVMMLAAAIYAWHKAQRFGPSELAERELPPARSEYIRAMGTALAGTRDREAARQALANNALQVLQLHHLTHADVDTLANIHRCEPRDIRALFAMDPDPDPSGAARAFAAIHSTAASLQLAGKDRS